MVGGGYTRFFNRGGCKPEPSFQTGIPPARASCRVRTREPSVNAFNDRATYDLTFKVPKKYTLVGVGKKVKE